jgi:hypothetical protein
LLPRSTAAAATVTRRSMGGRRKKSYEKENQISGSWLQQRREARKETAKPFRKPIRHTTLIDRTMNELGD